jgi:hypothetical protein
MHRLIASFVLAAMILGGGALSVAAASGGTYYVDGKTGSDSNNGLSPTSAFKTIHQAASKIPTGSAAAGWTVNVKGYTDYVYRERPIPPAWVRAGTSSAPVVFQATGYVAGSKTAYVKPIVSGANVAPASGQRWSASGTANVWRTPWATAPIDYGSLSGPLQTALFQDKTGWVWEQASLSALAGRAKLGKGGYWYDKTNHLLYASAVGSVASGTVDPSRHTIDVITRSAFLFIGDGIDHVMVRGFEVRHSLNGVAVKGGDYITIADNFFVGNLLMAIQTNGIMIGSTPNPSVGDVISRNRGAVNTLQFMKIDEGTQQATICDNEGWSNALQGIKVQGPRAGSLYTGQTTGIKLCRNSLHDNNYNPTGSAYTNTSGLTIANGAQNVTVDHNLIYRNRVGVHITQETSGRPSMNGIVLSHNEIHDNVRFGINFYDGANGSGGASGTMQSSYDVLWGNGIGVKVGQYSTHKTIAHVTVNGSGTDGIRVGENSSLRASANITAALLTGNGEYGLCVITNSTASLSYTGLSGNGLGPVKGVVQASALNTHSAGYQSAVPGSPDYLKITTSSYQYTAGPSGTPIGARY